MRIAHAWWLALAMAACSGEAPQAISSTQAIPITSAMPIASGQLLYYGGPVISNPIVVSVSWNSSVVQRIQDSMAPFYLALGGSDLWKMVAGEYGTRRNANAGSRLGSAGTQQDIGNIQSAVSAVLQQPTSQSLRDIDVQNALQAAFGTILPDPTDNTVYVVNMPPGTKLLDAWGNPSCSPPVVGFCGYHYYFTAAGVAVKYAVVMDTTVDCACSAAADYLDNTTASATHELIEMMTDPEPQPTNAYDYPQAWRSGTSGAEIGDLCASQLGLLPTLKPNGQPWVVQAEYDNVNGGCYGACTPIACASVPGRCGNISDQCAGTINCNCSGTDICVNNVCEPIPPPPPPSACVPAQCMQGCRDCNGSAGSCAGGACVCASKRSCF
jgi:hypothetical protein